MKIKDLYEELLEVAKTLGITVRRENGNFKSGFAILKDQQLIIINKTTPLETAASVIAKGLPDDALSHVFLKPVVRDYIEKENSSIKPDKDFNLFVDY